MQKDLKDKLLGELGALLQNTEPGADALRATMMFLHERREGYHWVGVYVLDGDTLVLGPYVGPKTDHVRIPVGRGVCGTAVAENRNQVISDVRDLDNYLACNLETRSEIVVLVRDPDGGKVLGQIDVDGTEVDRFRDEEDFLEDVAGLVATHVKTMGIPQVP